MVRVDILPTPLTLVQGNYCGVPEFLRNHFRLPDCMNDPHKLRLNSGPTKFEQLKRETIGISAFTITQLSQRYLDLCNGREDAHSFSYGLLRRIIQTAQVDVRGSIEQAVEVSVPST